MRSVILDKWAKGDTATKHNVYFGTSWSDVNSASDPNTSPGKGRQDANSFNPGTLEWGKTYYWKINEVNCTIVYNGDIWSFTTDFWPDVYTAGYGAFIIELRLDRIVVRK